jgi:hypothetical protein
VLKLLVVSLWSENQPTAVLKPPVVRLKSAESPSVVLPSGQLPSGGGKTPNAFGAGESAATAKINTYSEVVFLARLIGFINNFLLFSRLVDPCDFKVRKRRRKHREKQFHCGIPDSDFSNN